MWTWLKWVAGGLLLLLVVGWFNRSLVFWFVLAPIMLAPDQDFNGADFVALNYSEEMSWAALPTLSSRCACPDRRSARRV